MVCDSQLASGVFSNCQFLSHRKNWVWWCSVLGCGVMEELHRWPRLHWESRSFPQKNGTKGTKGTERTERKPNLRVWDLLGDGDVGAGNDPLSVTSFYHALDFPTLHPLAEARCVI